MKAKICFTLLILISCAGQRGIAQETPKDSLHDYCKICINHEHLIIAPPYSRTFKKELPFIMTSATVFAAGFITASLDRSRPYTAQQLIKDPLDVDDINFLDRSSANNWSPKTATASDYVLYTTAILPAIFLSEYHTGRDIKTLLMMYAEVFTLNYGLTEIAKNTAKRPRPYVYNTDLPMYTRTSSTSRKSFFSGHTSQTAAACFYFAKVIHDYHPTLNKRLKRSLWAFAATVPAINGYLRVRAGKHFPTDVITGYIVGAATGIMIPQLHRTKKSKDLKEQIDVGFMPLNGGMGISLSYTY